MSILSKLKNIEQANSSRLCVGLDTDIRKIPIFLLSERDPILRFNAAIINATSDIVSSYKLNVAFYEQFGFEGMDALAQTLDLIPQEIVTIADAKRGDIGNTSEAYAQTFFEYFNFDAVTVNPYMGLDSVQPFLNYREKMTFLLALTSNKGSEDFQRLDVGGEPLYKRVVRKAITWSDHENLGFVVGATHPEEIAELREIATNNLFLIPGIGTQGGDTLSTMSANGNSPVVVNVSRAILYASSGEDFAEKAREMALKYRSEIVGIVG